jgi:hypothetical protein
MAGLRDTVLAAAQAAAANPVAANNPDTWRALRNAALNSFEEGFTALTTPNSPYTWEQRLLLRGAQPDSGRQAFRFPFAVDIVGFRPVVIGVLPTNGALLNATADDIDVQIDLNNQNKITNSNGLTTAGGIGASSFVSLGSIGVQVPRIMGLRLAGTNPEVGFTVRWTQPPPSSAAPYYNDVIVKIGIYAYEWSEQPSANVSRALRGPGM